MADLVLHSEAKNAVCRLWTVAADDNGCIQLRLANDCLNQLLYTVDRGLDLSIYFVQQQLALDYCALCWKRQY